MRVFGAGVHMFTRLVFGTVTGRGKYGIVWFFLDIEGMRVRFVCLATRRGFAESLSAPERHHHHSCHVDRGKQSCQSADGPKQFAEHGTRQTECARAPCFPKNLILGKKTGKAWTSAYRPPAGQLAGECYRHAHLAPSTRPNASTGTSSIVTRPGRRG